MSSEATTPAATGTANDGEITVQVKCSNDTKYPITIASSATVLELKQALSTPSDCPPERQRLIYSGRVLKDGETLHSYKIGDGHTVHMVKGAATTGAAGASRSATGASATTMGSNATPGATATSTNTNNNNMNDAMEALRNAMMGGGMGGMGGQNTGASPGMNPFMSGDFGGGNMPPVDPAMSARMLQNPAFMRMFTEMMSQPEFQEMMTSMNPMMNTPEARAAMQSPEFQQMMSNPEMLSQMMGMMPSMMPGAAIGQGMGPGAGMGLGAFGQNMGTNPADNTPPEERYADQLRQLTEMGFWDAEQNLRALVASGGNVNRAVEMLLSGNV
ncbi:hypothetical protein BDF19DRAFT_431728 [Syncephalis fuscata]|nr:hypothetical protein BDF19DRAFT_431728 [Syncephalis fuscata]